MEPEEPTNNSAQNGRNPDGTFAVGNPGNPNATGRPPGTVSITTYIKQKLAEVPVGQRRILAETLAEEILDKAIVDKDTTMQKEVWAHIDGAPKQSVTHDIPQSLVDLLSHVANREGEK